MTKKTPKTIKQKVLKWINPYVEIVKNFFLDNKDIVVSLLKKLFKKIKTFFTSQETSSLHRRFLRKKRKICKRDNEGSSFPCVQNPLLASDFKSFFYSILLFVVLVTIFYIVQNIFKYFGFSRSIFSIINHGDLVQIHAGVGAIIFALIIFIAESLKDDSKKDTARILLRESWILPITTFEILTFLLMLFEYYISISIQSVLVIIVSFAVLYSLTKVTIILLNKTLFEQKRQNLLSERLNKAVDTAIDERIANGILAENMPDTFVYYPGWQREKQLVSFILKKQGRVINIDLNVFEKIIKIIEKKLNSEMKTLFPDKKKTGTVRGNSSVNRAESNNYQGIRKMIFWNKLFNDLISPENNIVLQVDESLIGNDPNIRSQIQSILNKSIDVKKSIDSFSEAYHDIDVIRKTTFSAIRDKDTNSLKGLLQVYINLTDNFLKALTKCGGGFSHKQASNERSGFADFKPLSLLDEDFREFIIEGYKTKDRHIIDTVADIPFSAMKRSISHKDHLTFQGYSRLVSNAHYLSYDLEKELGDKNRESIAKDLDTLVKYYLEPDVREYSDKENFTGFILQILLTSQEILKTSFEKKDIKGVTIVLELIDDFLSNTEDLYHVQNSETEKFNFNRKTLYFGFSAWVYKKYRENSGNEFYRDVFTLLQQKLPNDLKDLFLVYENANSREIDKIFGWAWWDIVSDGRVHSMNFNQEVDKLLVFSIFKILSQNTSLDISTLDLKSSRDIANYAQSDQHNPLTSLTAIPLGLDTSLNFNLLKEKAQALFSRILEIQKAEDGEYVRNAIIPESNKLRFYQETLKRFKEDVCIRKIFSKHGKLKDNLRPRTIEGEMGYNTLFPKEYYIDNWHITYIGTDDMGNNLAKSEDNYLISKISEGLNTEQESIQSSDLIVKVAEFISNNHFENYYLILWTKNYIDLQELRHSEFFTPYWQLRNTAQDIERFPYYEGDLVIDGKNIPVISIYSVDAGSHRDQALLISPGVAEIKQYSFVKNYKKEKKKVDENGFFFELVDLNTDDQRRSKILEENPPWLRSMGSNADIYLRKQALLYLFENIKVVIKNKKAGKKYLFNRS